MQASAADTRSSSDESERTFTLHRRSAGKNAYLMLEFLAWDNLPSPSIQELLMLEVRLTRLKTFASVGKVENTMALWCWLVSETPPPFTFVLGPYKRALRLLAWPRRQ